jgi:myo-inositol-1(or 4)-monophosphatase
MVSTKLREAYPTFDFVGATNKPGLAPPKFSYGSDATHQTLRLPLMPPSPLTVRSSVIALAMDTDRSGPNFDNSIEMSRRLLASRESGGAQCQSLRHTGSSALHMAHMAAGHLDAWWQGGPWAWDVCAGWAILEEVGGMVAGSNPGEWHPPLDGRLWFAVRPAPEAEQRAFIEEVWSLQGDLRLNY